MDFTKGNAAKTNLVKLPQWLLSDAVSGHSNGQSDS